MLMLFLLAYGRRYVLGFLGLFDDLERRQRASARSPAAARRGREYILVTLAQPLVNGVVFGWSAGCSTCPRRSASASPWR